jgi:hypothetical protein
MTQQEFEEFLNEHGINDIGHSVPSQEEIDAIIEETSRIVAMRDEEIRNNPQMVAMTPSEAIDSLTETLANHEYSEQSTEEVTEEESTIESNLLVDSESSVELTPEEEALLAQAIESQNSEIPINSPSLLVEEATSRFSSAIWYEAIQKKHIILAGLGGIGSYVAFMLARMKPNRIIMYDDDRVEFTNMSGQLYSKNQIGSYKVNAIYQMMHDYADFYNGNVRTNRYDEESMALPIMICGFDNMAARRVFYNRWKSLVIAHPNPLGCLYIDGRLAAEEFQVFAIQGDDERAMKLYEDEWLFDDSEAEETLCSYKQTTFMANMIGSVMVNLFVNFVANECEPAFPRDVPFMTSYDASRMYFKVEM